MSTCQLGPPLAIQQNWLGQLTLGASLVYSSTVKDPTEVSNVTYSALLILVCSSS